MAKNLRTPIIKPRTQGGTFFTFGSALEDIGLNINEKTNRVELTHYAILDIPPFSVNGIDDKSFNLNTKGEYENNVGDMLFTEAFQNYVLNFETIVRNDTNYNFALSSTISEKVFWKWLFKNKTMNDFDEIKINNTTYYREVNPIVKGFGRISASSQRTDDYGIYNETFVQIPSSYGQMECLFKCTPDENYNTQKTFISESKYIENIKDEELTNGYITSTGIYAEPICDNETKSYTIVEPKDMFSLEMNINNLKDYYDTDNITYDSLAFGENLKINVQDNYSFNAILVYYSIYDANKKNIISTNAYGIYILDKSYSISDDVYEFTKLLKKKTTQTNVGTSFSFRLNIKASSAYSGDVQIIDNSTPAYAMSEDFNDVIKNLNIAVRKLNDNSILMYNISESNKYIKNMFIDIHNKVDTLNKTIENIQKDIYLNEKVTIHPNDITSPIQLSKNDALEVIRIANVTYDKDGNIGISFNANDIETLGDVAKSIIKKSLRYEINGKYYYDVMRYLLLLTTAIK